MPTSLSSDSHLDQDTITDGTVALLLAESGRDPHDEL
jgi:hypothetical protein